jgi:hypothetical protein
MAAGAGAFTAVAQGSTPAAAGTVKTVLKVLSAANKAIKLSELSVGFIGASGTAKPVLVELTTNSEAVAGTGTSVTPAQDDASDGNTVLATAARNFSVEPTVQTVIRTWRVHPQAGLMVQFPLGREPRSGINKGFCVRVTFETAETTTNIDAYLTFEE